MTEDLTGSHGPPVTVPAAWVARKIVAMPRPVRGVRREAKRHAALDERFAVAVVSPLVAI